MKATAQDLWVLAQTIYGEARGESLDGQTAIAWVVRNRAEQHPRWQGTTIAAICHAPRQFSCWNASDVNRPLLLAVTLNEPVFVRCLHTALAVLGEERPSPVGAATHYYAGARAPAWARGKTPVAVIGAHRFFEDIA